MGQPATQQQQQAAQQEAEKQAQLKAQQETEKAQQEQRAKERIDELNRRNKELERLINMDNRLQGVEQRVQQQAQPRPQLSPEQQQWDGFMRPKVDPILEEKLGPVRAAVFQLADQNDLLRTMLTYPEYRDEEIQREVEGIRQQRMQATGQPESRENVILWMRGRDPEKFKSAPRGEQQKQQNEGERQPVHVESGAGLGTSRATAQSTRTAEDSSVEEMEKWMSENNFKF